MEALLTVSGQELKQSLGFEVITSHSIGTFVRSLIRSRTDESDCHVFCCDITVGIYVSKPRIVKNGIEACAVT